MELMPNEGFYRRDPKSQKPSHQLRLSHYVNLLRLDDERHQVAESLTGGIREIADEAAMLSTWVKSHLAALGVSWK